jgi:hypothetical protein
VAVPDHDGQVAGLVAWLEGMGESVLVVSRAEYDALGPDILLERHLGAEPPRGGGN